MMILKDLLNTWNIISLWIKKNKNPLEVLKTLLQKFVAESPVLILNERSEYYKTARTAQLTAMERQGETVGLLRDDEGAHEDEKAPRTTKDESDMDEESEDDQTDTEVEEA